MCYFVQENIYHFFTLPSLFRAVVIGGLEPRGVSERGQKEKKTVYC